MQLWEATESVVTYMGTAAGCHTCRPRRPSVPEPGWMWAGEGRGAGLVLMVPLVNGY